MTLGVATVFAIAFVAAVAVYNVALVFVAYIAKDENGNDLSEAIGFESATEEDDDESE